MSPDAQHRSNIYDHAEKIENSVHLLKEAFGYLYSMPADRITILPGELSKQAFIDGHFIKLMQGARPLIIPLPLSKDHDFPVIESLEDISPAFKKLKKTLQHNDNRTLQENALHLSTKELLRAYRGLMPLTLENIPVLLSKLSYRTSKSGYTGSPTATANVLCAQLAWLVVDKTKRNPQEQFWKLLYPEVTGTYRVMADVHWPAYGEALLDANLIAGKNGELINYRHFYSEVNNRSVPERFPANIPENTRNRIKTFHLGHYGFWFSEPAEDNKTTFKNYGEFFTSLWKFTRRHSKQVTGVEFEGKISAQGDDEFLREYAPGLQRFVRWHENKDYVTKKTDEAILCPAGRMSLIQVIYNLCARNEVQRCLNTNADALDLLFRNSDALTYLQNISFSLLISQESMRGFDDVDYLDSHGLYVADLDREGLLHVIKHGENEPMSEMAAQYVTFPVVEHTYNFEIDDIPNKAKDLLNFCVYINNEKKELDFMRALLAISQYSDPLGDEVYDHAYLFRIYDRLGLYEQRQALMKKIENILESDSQSVRFFYKLIFAVNRDIPSFSWLRTLEEFINGNTDVSVYINSSRVNSNDIHAILLLLPEVIEIKSLVGLNIFLKKITLPRQAFVFDFLKKQFQDAVKSGAELQQLLIEYPQLTDELLDCILPALAQKTTSAEIFHQNILKLNSSLFESYAKKVAAATSASPLFKSGQELNVFIAKLSVLHQPVVIKSILCPFYAQALHNLTEYLAITLKSASYDFFALFKEKISVWVTSNAAFKKVYKNLISNEIHVVVNVLLETKQLHLLLSDSDDVSCVMNHIQAEDFYPELLAVINDIPINSPTQNLLLYSLSGHKRNSPKEPDEPPAQRQRLNQL